MDTISNYLPDEPDEVEILAGTPPPDETPPEESGPSSYEYTQEMDAIRVPSFSSAAYGLDFSDLEEAADLNSAEEELDPAISWRAQNSSLPSGEGARLGVLHGDEVLESEDPAFLKQFLDEPDAGAAPDDESEIVVGVKFRRYGPVCFFSAGDYPVANGSKILVETEQGVGLAEVIAKRRLRRPLPPLRVADGVKVPIRPIAGMAGPEDIAAAADNQILGSSALLHCKECIRERELEMKLVDVEVLHDRSKIVFYFTAPSRIDFRELVKDLVRTYRTRIELRQIGVRHETQMLGSLGNCGMVCCCRRYLRRFAPVTIKMAKEQNLFLNPTKLSGICGRLLCCLSYEQENYEEFHQRCPKSGKKYNTARGPLKIMRANLFKQSITAASESGEEIELSLEEWQALNPVRMDNSEGREIRGEDRKAGGERRRDSVKPLSGQDSESLGWENGEGIENILPEELLTEDDSDGLPSGRGKQPKPQHQAQHNERPRPDKRHKPKHEQAEGRQRQQGAPGGGRSNIFGLNPKSGPGKDNQAGNDKRRFKDHNKGRTEQ